MVQRQKDKLRPWEALSSNTEKKKHLQSMHLIVETRKPNFPCNSKLRCKLVNLNKEKSHDTCS